MSVIQQAKEIWNRLPMPGRIATISAAVVTVGLIGAMVYYSSQGEYGVLFADLKPADAQAIVEKLKAANVPYSLSNNGTTVNVPTDRVVEMRLQMASSGVLSGGHVGFDLFDKTNFGATDFAQQVNFRRAIEGELGTTLEGMDEIEAARVHITPQKESVFTEKAAGAKASVMLRVKQGKELSNDRTQAIVSLISSSVEGLDPSGVSVMDTNGRLLSNGNGKAGGSFGDAGAFNAQLEAKRKYESETAARIIAMITPIAGEGKVRADVAADVDFSQVEQTEEKYAPDTKYVRSQQNSQDTKTANSSNPISQIAGTRANDPNAPAGAIQPQGNPPAATQTGNDQRTNSTINYELDKTVKRTIGGTGRVNRMTVSVLVDYKTENNVDAARTADEIQKIQELVAAAVGTDQARGDSVVVQTMPFDKPAVPEATAASWFDKNRSLVMTGIKYGSFLLVAVLLFLFVIRPAKKALSAAAAPAAIGEDPKLLAAAKEETDEKRQLEEDEEMMNLPPMTVAEMEAKMVADLKEEVVVEVKEEKPNIDTVRTKLMEQAMIDPELVAGTLRGWLRE
jgi:flagellar M-ring protein FliF